MHSPQQSAGTQATTPAAPAATQATAGTHGCFSDAAGPAEQSSILHHISATARTAKSEELPQNGTLASSFVVSFATFSASALDTGVRPKNRITGTGGAGVSGSGSKEFGVPWLVAAAAGFPLKPGKPCDARLASGVGPFPGVRWRRAEAPSFPAVAGERSAARGDIASSTTCAVFCAAFCAVCATLYTHPVMTPAQRNRDRKRVGKSAREEGTHRRCVKPDLGKQPLEDRVNVDRGGVRTEHNGSDDEAHPRVARRLRQQDHGRRAQHPQDERLRAVLHPGRPVLFGHFHKVPVHRRTERSRAGRSTTREDV